MKRIFTGFIAVAMAASFVAPSIAGAATVAEVQAMIAQLQAQLAALTGGAATGAAVQFNTNLTIGSTGADVTALQQYLVSKGFLQMPVNVSYGYFGPITRGAVARWQAANGIAPAVGYFGPISRAALNGMIVTGGTTTGGGTVVTCPAGYTCTVNGGTSSGTITTPGAEGTLSVTSAPVSTGTLYEGDSMKEVLAFKVKAQNSDIAIQRVKLNLGNSTTIYNKIYSKVYLVDENGSVLASSALNSDTVVKDGSTYYITLSGFSHVVSKDATKTFSIKMDVRSNIDSGDLTSYTLQLANDGVRGIDGAGIDQYSPTTGSSVSKSVTISAILLDSASVTLSTGADTPVTQEVIASLGSANNELDKVTLLTFDIKADKDVVLLTDLVATITRSGGAATASSTYLYVDGNQIGSASLSGSTATFSDIDYSIPKDSTKTFTIKADIRSASATQTTIAASVANSGLTAENSIGDSVSKSGSATGNEILVRSDGPVFTLVSKSITYTAGGFLGATSTAKASFVINAKALGNDVYFGTQAASSTFAFGTYKGSVLTTLLVGSSTSYVIPSTGVVTSGMTGANAFKISENGNANIAVDFIFEGRTAAGALLAVDAYAVGLSGINWSLTGNDTSSSVFMLGRTEWRTSSVTMP